MALSNLLLATLIPLVLIAVIAGIIIGIGELLLAVGKLIAVPLALALAALILVGATILSRVSPSTPTADH